jgi:hypothetical protein
MSANAALLLLFVVLPLIVAPLVIAYVVRRSPEVAPEHRTSWLLEYGEATTGELVSWKNKGPFLFDSSPMVAFVVMADGERIEITQSVPRTVIARLSEGMSVDIRRSPDRQAAAIGFPVE